MREVRYQKDDAQGALSALNSVKEPQNYLTDGERDLYGEADLFSWGQKGREKIILAYGSQRDVPGGTPHYKNGSFTVYTLHGSQRQEHVVKYSETESGFPYKDVKSAFRAAVIIAKSEIAKYK